MAVMDEQLKALGRITMEFSWLEIVVGLSIRRLLKDSVVMVLTANLPFNRLCSSSVAVAREKLKTNPEAIERLEGLMKQAFHLEGERNRLIHSWWVRSDDPQGPLSRIKVTGRGRLEVKMETDLTPDELNEVANQMETTALALGVWMKDNGLL